jgi:2,5-diamino-6-(ribosylamino)-4(3H)-pyrimidinone 5'-phosphate reductase
MSADGKIALPSRRQLRISNDKDIERVYKLRNECDAVLVGIGAILSDDPKLTVNDKYVKNPRQPLRVVLDSSARTPGDAVILNDAAKTLIVTIQGNEKHFDGDHIEVVGIQNDDEGYVNLESMLNVLYHKGIKKLLVEGGGTVIWSFLREKLVDDLYTYIGPCIIGGKNTPTMADGSGIKNEDNLLFLRIIDANKLGDGLLVHYKLIK